MSLTRVVVLVVALAVAAPFVPRVVASTPIHCSKSDPTTCPNTNYLVWSPGFSAAVARFAGDNKVGYFLPDQPLSSQALRGLGGPPQDRVELPGKRYLFSACPPHDCAGNAAAIILDEQGGIQALGFSSFHCGPTCDFSHRHLDFYLHQAEQGEALVTALKAWGSGEQIRRLLMEPDVDDGIEERTVIHFLP